MIYLLTYLLHCWLSAYMYPIVIFSLVLSSIHTRIWWCVDVWVSPYPIIFSLISILYLYHCLYAYQLIFSSLYILLSFNVPVYECVCIYTSIYNYPFITFIHYPYHSRVLVYLRIITCFKLKIKLNSITVHLNCKVHLLLEWDRDYYCTIFFFPSTKAFSKYADVYIAFIIILSRGKKIKTDSYMYVTFLNYYHCTYVVLSYVLSRMNILTKLISYSKNKYIFLVDVKSHYIIILEITKIITYYVIPHIHE